MRVTRRSVFATGLAGLALSPFSGRAQASQPFAIGAILSMTGAAPHYGRVMSQAAQLAVDEINAAGGVAGVQLQLFIEDHRSGDAQAAVSGFNRLVSLRGAQAILSSFSGPTVAIAPLSRDREILVLNGGGVSPRMIGVSPFMFHNRSMASDLAAGIVRRARERDMRRIAQIAIKDEFGDSTIAATSAAAQQLGLDVTAVEQFVNNAGNIDTQIAKLRASRPDVVANWPTSPQAGLVVRRMREMGMSQPVLSMEWTPEDTRIAGRHAEGVEVVTDYFAVTDDNPWGRRFADAYKTRFGDMPDFYAANYYEAVYVIAELVRRVRAEGGDAITGAKLAAALRANPQVDSVYGGRMRFRDDGVALKRVALLRVQNGEPRFERLIDAE